MTYRELKTALERLNADQLACDITMYYGQVDEFISTRLTLQFASEDTQVLDPEHPFFVLRPVQSH